MIDIGKEIVEANCDKCNAPIKVTLKQIADQITFKCSSCSEEIKLIDKNGSAKKSIEDANAAFDKLNDAFKNFGK